MPFAAKLVTSAIRPGIQLDQHPASHRSHEYILQERT